MDKKRVIAITLAMILMVCAWRIIRVHIYFGGNKTVTLQNGLRVSAHLVEVKRLVDDVVKVTMELKWNPRKGEKVIIPDMAVTRPLAVLSPRQSDGGVGDRYAEYTAYFQMKDRASTVDIVQTVLCRKPSDVVYVDFPISIPTNANRIQRIGSARIEYMDSGKGSRYSSDEWLNDQVDEDPSPDSFCVRINQTDPDGPLRVWSFFTWELDAGGSCTAELIDERGHVLPQVASLFAKSSCTLLEGTQHLIPERERLRRRLIETLSLGHIKITGGYAVTTSVWSPGNGQCLYVFKPKRSVRYSKIRIKYVLPPKPEDRMSIIFKNVPI